MIEKKKLEALRKGRGALYKQVWEIVEANREPIITEEQLEFLLKQPYRGPKEYKPNLELTGYSELPEPAVI